MKRAISFSLALLITALSAFSCGGSDTQVVEDTTAPSGTDTTTASAEEMFAGLDFGGYKLRILNPENRLWNTMSLLDFEEQTGDSVEDAIFNRNRFVEETYNMTIEVINAASEDCQKEFEKDIVAGDDSFDAAFLLTNYTATNITSGYLRNLYDLEGVDIDQPWWYPKFNHALVLEGNKLYQAATAAHFMSFDMTAACYFNKQIIEPYNMESLYDVVRSGNWTFDTMLTYMKQCINLNGEDSFKPNTGTSIYGVTTFGGWLGVLTGSSHSLIKLDEKGSPYYSGPTEQFYDYLNKLSEVFVGEGRCIDCSHYTNKFYEGRTAFEILSLEKTSVYRYMDQEYGILPVPKYSASDDYSSPMGVSLLLCIPSTSKTAEKTAQAFNVLSYHSYKDVSDIYYQSLCHKGLRDEDSIEMLGIISDSRCTDIGHVYGWTYSIMTSMCANLLADKLNAASYIESVRSKLENSISATMNT